MFDPELDSRVRNAAFQWLSDHVSRFGEVIKRETLLEGFSVGGERVLLISPAQGIFKPRILTDVPLSITTSPRSPYNDAFGKDGLLRYKYRGTDPAHQDNRGLRLAMKKQLPLIYFHGIVPGKYLAEWPVYIVADMPAELTFSVAVEHAHNLPIESFGGASRAGEDLEDLKRKYAMSLVRARVHQRAFRERVLDAYRNQCAFCRLRHSELLDAAHIIADSEPEGEPLVRNGLALCSLHHVAFDRNFLGLRPDLTLEVRPDILLEEDGPTMVHAIQALHGKHIDIPRQKNLRPSIDLVILKYEKYSLQLKR